MSLTEFPNPKDKAGLLRRIPVFSSCTDQQLSLIAERTRLLEVKKGEYVYREGETADALYIVVSGRMRVLARSGNQEVTLATLHNDDSFGEISLLTGETHSASMQAVNDTLILQLEKADFDDVINRIPSLVLHLSRLLSKRLRLRERDGAFPEATIVSVYSAAPEVGCTLLAACLAASLRRETGRATVIVDLVNEEGADPLLYDGATAVTGAEALDLPVEMAAMFRPHVLEHPLGFHLVPAGHLRRLPRGEELVAPLLSALTKRYGYILLDLPSELSPAVFKSLTQSDQIYFVTDPDPDGVTRTKALLERMRETVSVGLGQPVKLVFNRRRDPDSEHPPEAALGLADVATRLERLIDYVLPHVDFPTQEASRQDVQDMLEKQESLYALTVRRMARELSGRLVGLALGSGAALGLAHIGILKVLEREKIPIDMVAGTSIGSLVGGLWAAGIPAADLEKMAMRFKRGWEFRQLFILDVGPPFPSLLFGAAVGALLYFFTGFWVALFFGIQASLIVGLLLGPLAGGPIRGVNLMRRIEEDFGGRRFEDTRIPLRVVAANPISREEVIFDSGPIADAVRASVSIPGIFKPVIRKGKLCLDGGILNPVPVNVLKRAGVHRVIAVNVFPTGTELAQTLEEARLRREEKDAQLATRSFLIRLFAWLRQEIIRSVSPLVFDVIMRSMQTMEHQIAEVACLQADLTLRPTVPGSHWLEFFHPEKFIQKGEETALQHLPEIRRIAGVRDVDISS